MVSPADLDPIITQFLAHAAQRMSALDLTKLSIEERREASDQLGNALFQDIAEPGPEVASVVSHVVEGRDTPIPVRLYTPLGTGPFGVHVTLHGGGWWQGSINDWISDVQARERAVGGNCIVVAVEYRLAPAHPYPAALQDVSAAMAWVRDTAAAWNGDPDNISLGGVSAGANIAAGALVRAIEAGEPLPRFAIFEAGVFDFSLEYPSFVDYAEGFGLETAALPAMFAMYAPRPDDAASPHVSPIRSARLGEFPPTHLMTASWDPTNGTSDAFAARLREAGVPVTTRCFEGQIHSSPVMTKIFAPAREWRENVFDLLCAGHRQLVSNTVGR